MLTSIDMTLPNADPAGAQTWIFQGNPDTFNIAAAVMELKEILNSWVKHEGLKEVTLYI